MPRAVSFAELDAAALRVHVADPGPAARWARRWVFGIDKSLECARRCERSSTPSGLLAAAAVSLIEAKECPEDDAGQWHFETKVREAERLIAAALEALSA